MLCIVIVGLEFNCIQMIFALCSFLGGGGGVAVDKFIAHVAALHSNTTQTTVRRGSGSGIIEAKSFPSVAEATGAYSNDLLLLYFCCVGVIENEFVIVTMFHGDYEAYSHSGTTCH